MSDFSTDTVMRLARMSRIALTPEEAQDFAHELAGITDSIERVQKLDLENTPATSHPLPLENVMRKDEVGPTLDRDEVLAAAPEAQDGMFRVAQILGEE
ncbi:asparaginyl/glutamyl-tRNA amidotransferase subunit C [Boudabousia liubingyangii]|uniref:Aspartyl/glutamyl-tRNA(Asn/Gln) amidotransferase subunit C n=1 Tax=Boudabousia liubingyangii TaxID=1921764 RepID=A0A1Q5PQK4_9ACTO|nr:Asp-tRNA(Asn)/Glu-tRNA(Gln) amidotransferase subunit GatC [Boudabousia liubingyangii]OKL46101.1 asparaginyl/glutamyl-tRNA amidotransferase subunit C [Boudabousia liubingyangii]OKL49847.1 asparaginyl/glutamyl-tRNA amidotransferase subunit C [Boudabousia liubingyangii]